MTAKRSSRPGPPTALGRGLRITLSALALSALICLGAASQSLASTGHVYFDNNGNAAAGGFLFGSLGSGSGNVGVGST